jgi:FkbM family methyltransferase
MLLALGRAVRPFPLLRRWIQAPLKLWARLGWPGGWRVVEAGGVLYLVHRLGLVDRHLAFWGGFEAEQIEALAADMRRTGCDLFLDVGSNYGHYALQVARRVAPARIVAFECDPRNLARLRANLLLNGPLGDRIEVVEKAASSASGTLAFEQRGEGNPGASRVSAGGGIAVEAVRVDEVVRAEGLAVFAKIDVEGHELEAVEGMSGLLAANRVVLQVEAFPDRLPALERRLAEAGLRLVRSHGDDHVFAPVGRG